MTPDMLPIREMIFEKVKVCAQQVMANEPFLRNHLDMRVVMDEAARRLTLQLHSFVLAKGDRRIDVERKWPKDWWQAVKERFAPRWFLQRWPVRYESVSIHDVVWRVCPHVDMKTPDGRRVHFQWLETGSLMGRWQP